MPKDRGGVLVVAALLALGATLVRRRDEDVHWDVLADPEGNEFCVFDPAG